MAVNLIRTEQAAALLGVRPQTLRKAHSQTGHYLGLRPRKLPNRLLLWPADEIERLLTGSSGGSGHEQTP